MGKILIIGEAPTLQFPKPFTGPSGANLAKIADVEHQVLLDRFDFRNIFEEPRSAFPVGLAKERWDEMSQEVLTTYRRIICAGMAVGDAIIYGKITNRRRSTHVCEWMPRPDGGEIAIVPHPSGRNYWYNSTSNKLLVRNFLQTCMEAS